MTPFQVWYEKNKAEYNRARSERRKRDPEYARLQDSYKKKPKGEFAPPDGINLAEYATIKGVSYWSLLSWRDRSYFPKPVKYKNCQWFHRHNLPLLDALSKFFKYHGPRVPAAKKEELDDLVNWVHANWTTLEIK